MENPLPSPSRRSELIYELMMMIEEAGDSKFLMYPQFLMKLIEGDIPNFSKIGQKLISGKRTFKDSKKLDEDNLDLKELTARYHSLATDVSTLQTSVSTLKTNKMVTIQLATFNNKLLKQILSTLAALFKPSTSSNPMDAKVRKKVRVESDQHSVGQHQAQLETEISKPLSTSAEPIFSSVVTDSSSTTTEPLNQEKAKGKMLVREEEVQGDVSEHISTDPHNIILGTNMPLELADEIA
ncbi:hypothetical protein L1987_40018 [Smallanthus sonchifolius]|uniref:Uncharacterized protein n=1 Tax=Smallanthus sonchifolius TaxID=185202 RepID=A0ACB9GTS6_9ASTR|nr:hypothetical protein L1987_40018 [Smallanthus sonchifolius]